MGSTESRQLRPAHTITNAVLIIPTAFVGLVDALANLKRDGKETDETEFLYELFQVYDKINGTDLHAQFKKAIDAARKSGQRQVNWTELHKSMPGVKGQGYSATISWVCNALMASADKLEEVDIARLFHLAKKVCQWREGEMSRHGGGDTGHQHAFKLWEAVRDLLKEFIFAKKWKDDL